MKLLKDNINYFKKHNLHNPIKGRQTYFVNGFGSLFKRLSNLLDMDIIEFFPIAHGFDIITNFLFYFAKKMKGDIKKYNIIHINNWENFLNAKKYKSQILIGESHGFHFGLNFRDTLKHFKGIKKYISILVEFLLGGLIRYKINIFDIYYVSTPNMLKFAKKIRLDAKWLPNAIDIDIFNCNGNISKLRGNPIIFQPTRLHSFKDPKFGIDLFFKIKEKYPEATLHLIEYPNGGDYYEEYYKKKLTDTNTFFWHGFKSKNELAEMYRGADIVLGHFHKDLGMMSLVELEATLCGTAVISYDKYEIKTELNQLENITFEILEDKNLYNEFVKKNMKIVLENHSPEKVAKKLIKDIEFSKQNIIIKKLSKKIILKYKDELLKIEDTYFNEVGNWDINNFLYKLDNKFESSFLLFSGNKLVGYIIGSHNNDFGYVNRFAVNSSCKGLGLGRYLLEYFSDNLRYNTSVKTIELVTHMQLHIDGFYLKNGYIKYNTKEDLKLFLNRKNKISDLDNYIGDKKYIIAFYKNI